MADSGDDVDLDALLEELGVKESPPEDDLQQTIEEIENLLDGELSGDDSDGDLSDDSDLGGAASVQASRSSSTCKGCNGRGNRLCHICKGKGTCKRGTNCSGSGYLKAKCMKCKGTGRIGGSVAASSSGASSSSGAASVQASQKSSLPCKGCNGRGNRLCHICKGKGTCKRGTNCSGSGYLKAKCMKCKGTGRV
eukprot:CAMPEP_0201500846 /NCGR_PEP_ID=MMETSP0151_2-20130828/83277_1 /ASSEMBLY_ACC=CAM_ASM_000257 /TAXON_ID=200890 /ORGANISM="Paramoeba atlantica, Strain 621/1 / CCAP 1560/9" /LENGTH=193 /DNA_ID=CAMNT_0047894315 /DNA_START=63 /DNA_END=644 /DNA_ORIENTATION=+